MYPLKFQPVFQRRLWGGSRLHGLLGKATPAGEPIGESWEIADLPPGTVQADSQGAAPDGSLSSIITNGPLGGQSLHKFWEQLRSTNQQLGSCFPLLIKFLDSRQDLSVQVHPDRKWCENHPDARVKNEAWYILHAEPGAKIYRGLRKGITRELLRMALQANTVEPLLNDIPARPGDCHYLPSGTLHALGAGIVVAEVQTPSDTTFRLYDWNRLGADGKPRKLHVEEALACTSFDAIEPPPPTQKRFSDATRLVECPDFIIDRAQIGRGQTCSIHDEAPRILIIVDGQGVIHAEGPTAITRGETLLIPPAIKAAVTALAPLTWLEVRLP